MGKKKHKKDAHEKSGHAKGGHGAGAGETGKGHDPLAPLAGIAAALVHKADSPEVRQLLASGLTMAAAAASAALMKMPAAGAAGAAPVAPVPPVAPVAPEPPVPPVPPVPPQGTTTSPDPHEIGVALGKAAEQVLGAFLRKKPGV